MKIPATSSLRLLVLLAASARLAAQGIDAPAGDRPETLPHRLIVKVVPGAGSPIGYAKDLLDPVAGRLGVTSIASWINPALLATAPPASLPKQLAASAPDGLRGLARIVLISFSSDLTPESAAAIVRSLAGVEYAEPVYRRTLQYAPNDPALSQQSYLEQVKAYEGWDDTRADSAITIAIVDTGVDPDHPDLKSSLWTNPGETGEDLKGRDKRSNGVDDDHDGLIDDWRGYDFGGGDGYTPDNDPSPGYWHGTHVAGIAAATGDNGIGIAGIAFGARIMAVKISDDARDNPSLTAGGDGILYAAKMGARIINCSWGGAGYSQAEQDLMNTVTGMGSLVVAAAGNNGLPLSSYPASYRNVLSVASVQNSDERSGFSNFNAEVGIAAPGENIYSTVPISYSANGYMATRGTSMASPMVAGAAALLLRKYPELTPEQLAAVLRASADNIDTQNPDYRFQLGSGRLNVARALANGPNIMAASVLDYSVIEDNDDGVIEPGETIELRVRVKNILRPVTRMKLELTPMIGTAQILTPEETFDEVMTGEVRQSRAGVFRLTVPSGIPPDYSLTLQVTLTDGGAEIGRGMIELIINPNYATTAYNHTSVTFAGNGRIGFNDFPVNQRGRGFLLDSSNNLLAEGGLLVGVSTDRVADVVHSGNPSLQSNGLKTIEPYRLAFSASDNAQVGHARFSDAHLAAPQQVGIEVEMKTFQFRDSATARQTFVLYKIHNRTAVTLTNLFCALYLDWDLGPGGAYDQAESDFTNRLGYVHNLHYAHTPMAGAMLLSSQPMNFYALNNDGTYPLGNGFFQAEKWDVISNGIRHETSEVGDCAIAIGAGPIALEPGADTIVAFSLMAGDDLAELQAAAAAARARFTAMGETPGGPIDLPRQLSLQPPHPNPFDRSTTIEFRLPADGQISLDLYDPLGKHVKTIASGYYRKGMYQMPLTLPANQAEGAYMIRLRSGSAMTSEQVIRISNPK